MKAGGVFGGRRRCLAWAVGAVLVGTAACDTAPRLAAVAPGQTVLALGDSVTHGTGAGPSEDWPSLVAQATGWQVVNAGVPGDTAQLAQQRLAPLLEAHRPALLILEIGGNDLLRRRPPAEVKADLRAMLHTARAAGVATVLVAVPEPTLLGALAGRVRDAELYAEVAKEEGVALVPEVLAQVLSEPAWRADPIHPNAAGYRRLADGLLVRFKALGLWVPG